MADEKEMSFLDHIEELRWHIIRSLISVVVIGIAVFLAKDLVVAILFGPKNPDFVTYRFFCKHFGSMCNISSFDIIQRDLGEDFFTHISTSFWIGIMVSFPYIFWEIWRFVKPGLYPNEKKAARGIVFVCSTLFFLGVLFGYFVIAPFAIEFLSGYTFGENQNTVTLSSYVSYITMITLPAGLVFQLPVFAFFLGKIGIISSDLMKKFRKHAVVVILLVAAIITPPDVITQCLIAVPLLILYEISILIIKRIEKRNT
jgi:sec-independent protein translocase protein TatC